MFADIHMSEKRTFALEQLHLLVKPHCLLVKSELLSNWGCNPRFLIARAPLIFTGQPMEIWRFLKIGLPSGYLT
jgi:hypothetical protein